MSAVTDIIDTAKERAGITSDNALAIRMEVTRAAVSAWRNGKAYPDEVSCAKLADLAGLRLNHVLGTIGEARAISREAKAVWRRLASAAAVVLAVLLTGAPNRADALIAGANRTALPQMNQTSALYIMRRMKRSLRRFFVGIHPIFNRLRAA